MLRVNFYMERSFVGIRIKNVQVQYTPEEGEYYVP